MDGPTTLTAAFLLGLFSTVHCIGMCGGIIGALSLALPEHIREHKPRLWLFISSYNLGRIASYSLAGLLVGGLGHSLGDSVSGSVLAQGHSLLRYTGVVIMVAIGLYLAGWLPQLSMVEKLGLPLWRKLEPLGRRLLPVSTLPRALAYGMIWGWLPCGLVYFVLLWTLTSGGPIEGALTMLAFGLGTLPSLISAGVATGWIRRLARSQRARQVAGLVLITMAIGSLFVPMGGVHHH